MESKQSCFESIEQFSSGFLRERLLFLYFLLISCFSFIYEGVASDFSSNSPPFPPADIAVDQDETQWYCYGSEGGISSYDGSEWQHYTTANSDIINDAVDRIFIDRDNTVWVLYHDKIYGITRYDGKSWQTFFSWYFDYMYLHDAEVDQNGVIWVAGHLTFPDSPWDYASCYKDGAWTSYAIGTKSKLYFIKIDIDSDNIKWFTTRSRHLGFDDEKWFIDESEVSKASGDNIISGQYESTRSITTIAETGTRVDYFPLEIGNTWKYHRTVSCRSTHEDTAIFMIIGKRIIDGSTYFEFLDGRLYRNDEYGNVYEYVENSKNDKIRFDFSPCRVGECDDTRENPYIVSQGVIGMGRTKRYRLSKQVGGIFDGYIFSTLIAVEIGGYSYFLSPFVGTVYYRIFSDYGAEETLELVESSVYVSVETDWDGKMREKLPYVKFKDPFPNPFNISTTISFSIYTPGFTTLTIYNITGRKVRELVSENLTAGLHSVNWDGRDDTGSPVSSGLYIAHVKMGEYTAARSMMLLK